jgi:hypothetical protein
VVCNRWRALFADVFKLWNRSQLINLRDFCRCAHLQSEPHALRASLGKILLLADLGIDALVEKAKAVEGNRILNLEQHPKMRLIQIIMGAPHRGEADAISVSTTEAKGQVRDVPSTKVCA